MSQTAPCLICYLFLSSFKPNHSNCSLENSKALVCTDFMYQSEALAELRLKIHRYFKDPRHTDQIYLVSYFNFGQKPIAFIPFLQDKLQGLGSLLDECSSNVLALLIKMASVFYFYFLDYSQYWGHMKKALEIFTQFFQNRLHKIGCLEYQPFDFSKLFRFDFTCFLIFSLKTANPKGPRSF